MKILRIPAVSSSNFPFSEDLSNDWFFRIFKKKFVSCTILGDPGAVSRIDKMSVVKVYCKIETSPWALTLTEPVPEAFELPASDWPEKLFFDLPVRE